MAVPMTAKKPWLVMHVQIIGC